MTDAQVDTAKKVYEFFVEAGTLVDPDMPEPKRWRDLPEKDQKTWAIFTHTVLSAFPDGPPDPGKK
jgi:hypothetical protein